MKGVIEYYRRLDGAFQNTYVAGQMYLGPTPYVLESQPIRLRLLYYDPANRSATDMDLQRTDLATFRAEEDIPWRHLKVDSESYILTVPHKSRKVILISDPLTSPQQPAPGDSGFLVVPLYSVYDEMGNFKPGWNSELVARAVAYQLPQAFYVPADDMCQMKEGVARVDRMHFVRQEHLRALPVALTEKAVDLLRQWVWHFCGAPLLDGALEDYMKAAGEKLDREMKGD